MFSLATAESALHGISLRSRACVFNRTYLKSQIKCIRPASINFTSVYFCTCTPSLSKHVLQAPRFTGALLQRHNKYIPPAPINPATASYCSSTLPSAEHVLLAPSSLCTFPASTEPCPRLFAALPSCFNAKRSLHHSYMNCTRASIPLLKSSKSLIDHSLVPELLEEDLVELAIKGWGPGGQAVNKTNNAVFLKHVPTGLFVKVHKHRMAHKNSLEARVLLLDKLDDLVNGPRSVSAQKTRLLEKRSVKSESKARKMRDLKAQWKQALGGAGEDSPRDECDGSRDEREGRDGFRDESGSTGGSMDKSWSGSSLRDERAGSSRVNSGDGFANSKVGNEEQGNDLNERA